MTSGASRPLGAAALLTATILCCIPARGADSTVRPDLSPRMHPFRERLLFFAGAGIGALPEFMVPENSDLVPILPDLEGPRIDAYFVYPEELRGTQRVDVFRDFLLRQVAQSKF